MVRAVYEGRAVAVPVTAEVLFTGLGVSPESLVFGGSGGQATLQLFARYSDDSEQDVTDEATWASADTTVVTVDGSGTAIPVGLGETSVTADYDGNEIDIPVTVAVTFSGGEGTETEPYAITTAEQLNGLRFYTGEGGEGTYFELMGDIDLSDPDFVDDASGWVPIGAASGEPFAANLDGNGFTLSNLSIDRPEQTDQGLFGRLSDATVTDLHLEAVSISAQSRVGALAGEILNTAIHGVTASGSVETQNTATSGSNAGGLIGTASGSEIVDSGTNVTITAVDHNIGGLVGYLRTGGRVEDSYATGSVNAIGSRNGSSGGLIGSLDAGNIVDSFYTDGQFGEGAEKGMLITPTQLANESTFTNWDFITIWVMSGDHTRPVFLWEP